MLTLTIKELTDFRNAVRRDLIADGLSRPNIIKDQQLLFQLVNYGNEYLEKAKKDPTNDDAVIWFDFYFGDPAVVGMTWAYNPHDPLDSATGDNMFWRIWSETDPEIGSLASVQEQFAEYCVQRP